MKNEQLERFRDLVDVDVLLALRIAIGGQGRVGTTILKQLMELPVARIVGIDHDTVSAKEVPSLFPAGTEGQRKVVAGKQLVKYWTGDDKYEGAFMRIDHESFPRLRRILSDTDIFFWAADQWDILSDVCSMFYHEVPIVAVEMAARGAWGAIAWSAPGQGACVSCSLAARKKKTEHGASSLPLDVHSVANIAVSVALGLVLAGRKGGELFEDLLDPTRSLIVVSNRDNEFARTTNPHVPRMVRLLPTETRCSVCRG